MLLADIERQETMLSNARKQIAAGEIEVDDFKAIKTECNKALMLLKDKLSNLPNKGDSLKTIEPTGFSNYKVFRYTRTVQTCQSQKNAN